ncbi:imidazole glycerol phosphate synthase subunit HisH [Algihabitans albus]|uniref:imidazole glycerol phosphate synthase subunit HisH n=1 Tax=Algihabitans albus TaxID=2164067 RepID=UPI000E5C937C|nr:imidazole glycerol phosphate synthase subunit HisH [Algihabitans albus]
MTVAIVDYGSGNLRSAAKALERAARETGLDREIAVTGAPEEVAAADRIVLPGVGAFGDCRAGLLAIPGMADALEEAVGARARPFLGICVGMQLFASRGLEHGCHKGFDWIAGDVVKLSPKEPALKIPQMGWNELILGERAHPVLDGLPVGAHAYFVHSYHLEAAHPSQVLATVDYGGPVTATVGRDTLIGTQFHPEKSQATGLRLLANFLAWSP